MKKRKLKDVLHECLEKIEKGGMTAFESMDLYQEHNETLYRLLETAIAIRSTALPAPTKEYKQASKNRIFYELMEEFEPERSLPVYTPTTPKTYRRPLGLQPIFTIVLVLVLSFGVLVGGAQAADASSPGDFLYPVDLLLEDLQLALAPSEKAQIQLRLQFANERVEEANAEFALGHYEDGNEALTAYELQMQEIAELLGQSSALDDLELQNLAAQENAANTDVLNSLLDKLPEQAQDAVNHAIEASDHSANPNKPDAPPGQEDKDPPNTNDNEDKDDKADKAEEAQEAKETKDAEKDDVQATKEAEKDEKEQEKDNTKELEN